MGGSSVLIDDGAEHIDHGVPLHRGEGREILPRGAGRERRNTGIPMQGMVRCGSRGLKGVIELVRLQSQ